MHKSGAMRSHTREAEEEVKFCKQNLLTFCLAPSHPPHKPKWYLIFLLQYYSLGHCTSAHRAQSLSLLHFFFHFSTATAHMNGLVVYPFFHTQGTVAAQKKVTMHTEKKQEKNKQTRTPLPCPAHCPLHAGSRWAHESVIVRIGGYYDGGWGLGMVEQQTKTASRANQTNNGSQPATCSLGAHTTVPYTPSHLFSLPSTIDSSPFFISPPLLTSLSQARFLFLSAKR